MYFALQLVAWKFIIRMFTLWHWRYHHSNVLPGNAVPFQSADYPRGILLVSHSRNKQCIFSHWQNSMFILFWRKWIKSQILCDLLQPFQNNVVFKSISFCSTWVDFVNIDSTNWPSMRDLVFEIDFSKKY